MLIQNKYFWVERNGNFWNVLLQIFLGGALGKGMNRMDGELNLWLVKIKNKIQFWGGTGSNILRCGYIYQHKAF